jgi:hypothetical protein
MAKELVMLKRGRRNAIAAQVFGLPLAAFLLAGCASGSFINSGTGTTTVTTQNANPPSLPPLTAATAVNNYVGTQAAGKSAPENAVAIQIDQTSASYTYSDIAIAGTPTDPVANSTGNVEDWWHFRAFGDTTSGDGPQFYGVAVEEPSRFAFYAANGGQQIAALAPAQTSGCITPTAAATYEFITLAGSTFNSATDAAWGTVQVSASGSSFSFTGAKQYTEASVAATTGLIPFAAASCVQSAANPQLGYYIDTPASSANGNTEMRAFLGPTGLLMANLQAANSAGNPLPLPGVLGMVQPASAISLADVIGPVSGPNAYRALIYAPANSSGQVQYGLFGVDADYLESPSPGNDPFPSTNTSGLLGGWEVVSSNTARLEADNFGKGGGIAFGTQDANNPGLFPNALFIYPANLAPTCPAGTQIVNSVSSDGKQVPANCSSPAVAMVGLHDGKYVILVAGLSLVNTPETFAQSPMVIILVQN